MNSYITMADLRKLFEATEHRTRGGTRPISREWPTVSVEFFWNDTNFVGYILNKSSAPEVRHNYILQSNDGRWHIDIEVSGGLFYGVIKSQSFIGDKDQYNHDITMALLTV